MTGNFLCDAALVLGGTASALIILRAAMITYLPDRLCGPDGLLIDTHRISTPAQKAFARVRHQTRSRCHTPVSGAEIRRTTG